jgi:precorrin-6A/cobalt-precorrin-6A reductase
MPALRVLILGGAGEAATLAVHLAGDDRFAPVLSMAGATRSPRLPPIPWRIGGFGGIDGLVRYLNEQRMRALVVATHPFAQQMRRHAVEAARALAMPLLLVQRPAWTPVAGDRWTAVADMAAAAQALGSAPRRVLLTIGRKDLRPFAEAPWHAYVVRSVDAPPTESLPAGAEVIAARGPFTEEEDRRLLLEKSVEVIVTKNSGGAATGTKLAAARGLGLPVIMVDRPPAPDTQGLVVSRVADAAGALAWLEARHQAGSTAERGV